MSVENYTVDGNDYLCTVRGDHDTEWGRLKHIEISRKDGEEVQTFSELYKVKNAVCGRDAPAIEVYPPEERLVIDQPNRHLWVVMDMEVPFGIHNEDADTQI